MYTPSILDTPVRRTGPIDASLPNESLTFDWPMLDDGQVQIGVWQCTPGTFGWRTGDENESMFIVACHATIEHDDGSYDIEAGTLWAAPRHWNNRWTVHQTARKLFVIDQRPARQGPLLTCPTRTR